MDATHLDLRLEPNHFCPLALLPLFELFLVLELLPLASEFHLSDVDRVVECRDPVLERRLAITSLVDGRLDGATVVLIAVSVSYDSTEESRGEGLREIRTSHP